MALLLSLAGIYSVTSFTVARRTREIGVRVALGADRRRLVMTIFRRPLRQVGLGVLAGTAIVTLLMWMVFRDRMTLTHLGLVALYATFMLSVCLVASAVPMRRALAVEPTEALRAE
jgi:ABC-type antimicrobial peptide transport system permease subunit